jgi:hypothetical protein
MADQRYKRINAHETTFQGAGLIVFDATAKNGSPHVGKAVARAGQGTVDLTDDGTEVFGKLIKVEHDGYCTIQEQGYADLPFTGAMTYGDKSNLVGSATRGSVKAGTAVANVVNQSVQPIIADPMDATRVIVKFC